MPTFSPDGGAIAYHAGDGIHVAAVPAFGGDCTLDGATPTPPVVIPNGIEPDWGPADVPAARPVTNTKPTTSNPAKTDTTKTSLSVKVLSATRRAGLKLSVKVTGKGKLSATAKSGSKTVGKASKTVRKRGHRVPPAQGLPQRQARGEDHVEADRRHDGHADHHRKGRIVNAHLRGLTPYPRFRFASGR